MIKRIGKMICLALLFTIFLSIDVHAEDNQLFAPHGWSCKFTDSSDIKSLSCWSSQTIQVLDVKYAGGTTYCSAGQSLCWEYDTGLAWLWITDINSLTLPNPTVEDEEEYSVQYWDIKSEFMKYPPSYYDSSWELQYSDDNKYVGIWDLEKDPGNNNSCPVVDGNPGIFDAEYNKCYYSMFVNQPVNGVCQSISGISGRLQNFLNNQYCIYTLFGYEENHCSDTDRFGTSGVYLPNYGQCIGGAIDPDQDVDEYDGKFYCKDSVGNKTDPVVHYDGAYDNSEHYYYICKKDQEVIGDYSTQCWEYEFMDEAKTIDKFGPANSGHIALYCQTTVGANVELPPSGTIPEPEPDPGDGVYGCEVIPESIRNWINDTLNLVRYIALVIVIVLGVLDFLKAAGSGEAEIMKKAGTDFLKRIIAVVVLFILPLIVDLILNLIEIYGADSTCL